MTMNPQAQGGIPSSSLPPYPPPNSSSSCAAAHDMDPFHLFGATGNWDLVLSNEEVDNFIESLSSESSARTISEEDKKLRIREKVMAFLLNHALCVFREDKRKEGDCSEFSHRIDRIEITNGMGKMLEKPSEQPCAEAGTIAKCEFEIVEVEGNKIDEYAEKRNISGAASIIPTSSAPTSSAERTSVNLLEPFTVPHEETDNERETRSRSRHTSMNKIPSSLSRVCASIETGGDVVNILKPSSVEFPDDKEKANNTQRKRNMNKKAKQIRKDVSGNARKLNIEGNNKTKFGRILPKFITRSGMSTKPIYGHYQSLYWCSTCQKEFSSSYLAKHLKIHGAGLYACDICDKSFKTEKLCAQHERENHKNAFSKVHAAGISNSMFKGTTKSQKGIPLPDFFVRGGKEKIRGRNETMYHCLVCKYEFPTSRLDWHMKKHGIGLVPCEVCKKKFSSKQKCTQHKIKFHSNNVSR